MKRLKEGKRRRRVLLCRRHQELCRALCTGKPQRPAHQLFGQFARTRRRALIKQAHAISQRAVSEPG